MLKPVVNKPLSISLTAFYIHASSKLAVLSAELDALNLVFCSVNIIRIIRLGKYSRILTNFIMIWTSG